MTHVFDRRYRWPLLATLGVIVYGSLYPFHFVSGTFTGAVADLLGNDNMHSQPLSGLLANILFYMPFGGLLAGGLRRCPVVVRVVLIGVVATMLSISMELSQHFVPGRITTLTDVYPNVAGALLAGLILPAIVGRASRARRTLRLRDEPAAILLLVLFVAASLYPWVPSIDLTAWYHTALPARAIHTITVGATFREAAFWATVGVLISQLRGRAESRWLLGGLVVCILAARVVIAYAPLSASDVLGALIAVAVWSLATKLPPSALAAVVLLPLIGVTIAWRLSPLVWQSASHGYDWIPFDALLNGSMSANTQAALQKSFVYGSIIWLMHRADAPLSIATLVTAGGLFFLSLLATHLPGHNAQTTDALIALLIGIVLKLVNGARDRRRRPRQPPSTTRLAASARHAPPDHRHNAR